MGEVFKLYSVIPAKAGIHRDNDADLSGFSAVLTGMDPGFRRDDDEERG